MADIPLVWLSRDQARAVDRLAISRGISGDELMERAGAACAARICELFHPRSVWILCGGGNNGGDGFVIARHLVNRGLGVRLWLLGDRGRLSAETQRNLERWVAVGGAVEEILPAEGEGPLPELIVDCLLGTGSQGNPRGELARAIVWLNQLPISRVAIDLPSGLDCDTGRPGEPTVKADRTLTMVGPKIGFRAAQSRPFVGEWTVIDLGIPAKWVAEAVSATTASPPEGRE